MKENFLMDRLTLNTTIGRRKWVFFLSLIFGQPPIRVPPARVLICQINWREHFFLTMVTSSMEQLRVLNIPKKTEDQCWNSIIDNAMMCIYWRQLVDWS